MTIEVFFDCSSPWAYLGFEAVQPLAAEFGVPAVWKPVLVGGIFNAVNSSVYHTREHVPAKVAYMLKDIRDWVRITGHTIRFPPAVFPVNSAKAMRALIVLDEQGRLVPIARALFAAYWGDGRDISDEAVLGELLAQQGVDATAVLTRIGEPEVKAALRANTDEAIARGAFGVPTFYLDRDDMYFGVDRMPNLRDALERRAAAPHAAG